MLRQDSFRIQILGMDSHAQLKKEPRTNNIDNHAKPLGNKETHLNNTHIKKTNNIATQSVAGKEINDLIDLFKSVNPSYKVLFVRKVQRTATERMLRELGWEKLAGAIKMLPKTNKMEFAPKITTPLELENKLGKLIAFCQQLKEKKQNNIPIIL